MSQIETRGVARVTQSYEETDTSHVLTMEEVTNLTEESGKPADTLMNAVALIATRIRTAFVFYQRALYKARTAPAGSELVPGAEYLQFRYLAANIFAVKSIPSTTPQEPEQ